MNVAEVSMLYECLRTVVKHFESSIKNKELLDEAMEILELQPLHLISWCQTRMGHFLKACKVFDMFPAVYDTMYTKGIRVDERDLLFTAENIFIVKVLVDIQPNFEKGYLRKVDKSSLLVSTVYNTVKSFASSITSVKTPSADKFKDSLRLDENVNLLADTEIKDNIPTIMLNHPHKPSRHITKEERILKIKEGLTKLKERITANIEPNILDQCGKNTFYYCWSGLDLSDKIPSDTRIECLRDVITLLCTVKVHTIGRYNDYKESEIVPDLWNGYTVSISFSKQWCVILDKLD